MYRLVVRAQTSWSADQARYHPTATLYATDGMRDGNQLRAWARWGDWLGSAAFQADGVRFGRVVPGVYVTDEMPGVPPRTYEELLQRLGVPPDGQEPDVVDAVAADEKAG